jgi:hypothetical protein
VRSDAKGQADVWNVRKLGLGLISNVQGPVKGQAFVEDACVPVEVLAEYIERLQQSAANLDVPTTMYAHASVGVIHFRPILDLHRRSTARRWSGSPTGFRDGVPVRRRVCRRTRRRVGARRVHPALLRPAVVRSVPAVKGLFDPAGLMNPGKIVDSPSMISHLRYGDAYRMTDAPNHFHYREQGGFQLAVEQCNGVGACRKLDAGTMCPSYMATRDEEATTRGRANALRLAMTGQLGDPSAGQRPGQAGARIVPGLQSVQDRVSQRGRYVAAEKRSAADASRPARRSAGLPADRRHARHGPLAGRPVGARGQRWPACRATVG